MMPESSWAKKGSKIKAVTFGKKTRTFFGVTRATDRVQNGRLNYPVKFNNLRQKSTQTASLKAYLQV